MKIDRKLNIVMPVETEKHGLAYVHSVSIGREIFEQFYLELGKVYSECLGAGDASYMITSAPQLAYPALKSISTKLGTWDENGGVKLGLVNEIIRLTNIVLSTPSGWETMPLSSAVSRKMLNEDEEAEVLSAIVFFTVISRVAPKELKASFLEMAGSIRKWELTSSDCSVFRNSLPTLTQTENTGLKAVGSSVIC
jgi:hypothetical protein